MSSNGKKVEDMILSDCSFETLKSFLSTAQFSNPWKVVFSDTDRTILMAAAKYGKYELCYHILQFRSDNINITNSKGYTALHYASYNGKSDIAQLLCGRGADIGILNNNNETPMDAALISRNFNIQQKMLSNFIFPLSTSVLFEQSDSFCCKGNIKHDIESGNRSCGKRHNYWIWNSGSDLARGRFGKLP
jgi:ankyrin repeat protein